VQGRDGDRSISAARAWEVSPIGECGLGRGLACLAGTEARMTKRPTFAPVPPRIVLDPRRDDRHLVALTVVALHDAMSMHRAGASGCYVSFESLASKCGLNYSVFSATVNDLVRWGYLIKERKGRSFILHVVYTDADADMRLADGNWKAIRFDQVGSDSLPNRQSVHMHDSLPTGQTIEDDARAADFAHQANCEATTVCPENRQATENTQSISDNIFRETVLNKSGETEEILQKRGQAERSARVDASAFLVTVQREIEANPAKAKRLIERALANPQLDGTTVSKLAEMLDGITAKATTDAVATVTKADAA
jgi:hypothetical protein